MTFLAAGCIVVGADLRRHDDKVDRAHYQTVQLILGGALPVCRVAIVDPMSSEVRLPAGSAGAGRRVLAGQRVTDDWIGDVDVDDAYVDRLAPRRTRARRHSAASLSCCCGEWGRSTARPGGRMPA